MPWATMLGSGVRECRGSSVKQAGRSIRRVFSSLMLCVFRSFHQLCFKALYPSTNTNLVFCRFFAMKLYADKCNPFTLRVLVADQLAGTKVSIQYMKRNGQFLALQNFSLICAIYLQIFHLGCLLCLKAFNISYIHCKGFNLDNFRLHQA